MADGNQQNRPAPNALTEYKLRLVGQKVNPEAKRPTLGFSVKKNTPQIDVRTGVMNDKDYGRISAKFPSTFDFFAAIQLVIDVAAGPNGAKEAIKINATRFINGKRSEPMLDSHFMVGKDENGVVWVGVTSWEKDRPVIKFPLVSDEMLRYQHGDGTPWTPGEISVLYAKAYVAAMQELIPFVLYHEFTPPPPRDGQGGYGNRGGGGGGNNWGGNRNGGGNSGGGGGGNYNSGGGNSGGGGGGNYGGGDDFPM